MRFIIIALFFICHIPTLMAQNNETDLLNDVERYKIENNGQLTAASLNKLAFLYWEQGKNEKALASFEQSIVYNKEVGNENAVKAIYANMGMIYSDMGQPETSLLFFRKSLLISRNLNQKQDIATNLINVSVALKTLNRFDEGIQNLLEALQLVTELNNKRLLRTCYGELAEQYEKAGNSENSMEYFSLYASFQKQIQKEEVEKEKKETKKEMAHMEKKTQKAMSEKKQTEKELVVTQDSLKKSGQIILQNQLKLRLQDLAMQAKEAELKSKKLQVAIFIILTGFMALMALFILRGYRQKKKHNKVLEQRNEEIKQKNNKINQSINYAKNIQGAILPSNELLTELFPESFVYFSPRDVVSGDFYWYNKVDDYKIISAVDCTGHGVPGAFMSMLGMSFLDEIIDEKKIIEPVQILEEMHVMVKNSLKQETTGNTDGMDMALCVYNEKKKELKFAGAVNPLVYVQNGELKIAKAEFFGIGGQMKGSERMFSQQSITINEPTMCYIFSDGFADQFGGEKGRKYFTKNFKKLLLEISSKPMAEQHGILKQTLNDWHGDKYSRIDDVLVMGFKIQ